MKLTPFLQLEDTPATSERPQIGYDFDTHSDRGMVKGFQLKGAVVSTDQIADGAVTTDKIAQLAVNTGDIANGAVTTIKIGSSIDNKLITNGTVGTALIGTARIIGGTITALIGTSTITGGTITPNKYAFGTWSGFTGTLGYLNAATTPGTMTFQGGLLVGTT